MSNLQSISHAQASAIMQSNYAFQTQNNSAIGGLMGQMHELRGMRQEAAKGLGSKRRFRRKRARYQLRTIDQQMTKLNTQMQQRFQQGAAVDMYSTGLAMQLMNPNANCFHCNAHLAAGLASAAYSRGIIPMC